MKSLFPPFALVSILALTGCASHQPKPEVTHEQGWFGGRYKCAKARPTLGNWVSGGEHIIYSFPAELEHQQKAGILALDIGTNTPAYLAGLRPGDLLLQVDRRPVTSYGNFWRVVHATRPGSEVPVQYYRSGQMAECVLTVGREKFRNQGTIMVGLPGYWDHPHLIPTKDNPKLSLVALGWRSAADEPAEFQAVEEQYRHTCHPKDKVEGWNEDWRCWLAIIQVTRSKSILTQDLASESH